MMTSSIWKIKSFNLKIINRTLLRI